MLLPLYMLIAVLATAILIFSDFPPLRLMAAIMFIVLAVTSATIDTRNCDLTSVDAWSCDTDTTSEAGLIYLFAAIGLVTAFSEAVGIYEQVKNSVG